MTRVELLEEECQALTDAMLASRDNPRRIITGLYAFAVALEAAELNCDAVEIVSEGYLSIQDQFA